MRNGPILRKLKQKTSSRMHTTHNHLLLFLFIITSSIANNRENLFKRIKYRIVINIKLHPRISLIKLDLDNNY